MIEKFELSRDSLSRTTGNTESDLEYLRWFASTCENHIEAAARGIMAVYDGRVSIDDTTESQLKAWMLSVGLYTSLLEQGKDMFVNRKEVAQIFSETLQRLPTPFSIGSYAIPLLRLANPHLS